MSTYLPQYVMTRDPHVLETVAANRAALADWLARVREFAKDLGVTGGNVYVNGALGDSFVTGVPDVPEGRGQWTKGKSRRPYKSNTEWYGRMRALSVSIEPLPGLPEIVEQPDPRGRYDSLWWNPSRNAFESAGAVYADLKAKSRPARTSDDIDLDVWTEIKASEFFTAKEAADQ